MRHPIAFILFGALVAVLVLYPIRVVDSADVATSVEGENFDVKPTGTKVVTDTALYSNGRALKFSNNTAIAKETVNFTSSGDVVLMARAEQKGGSPKLRVSVNGTFTAPAQTITNSGAPQPYTFDVNAPSGSVTIGVKAANTGSGRQPYLDYVTFPASGGGTDTTPPETSITSADLGTTNDNTPTFTFTGTDEAGVTGFECRVYASGSPAPAFSSCASPYTTATLSDGNYVFEVRAKDAAGNADATPASDSFTVSGDAPSAAKPNFVFILADDMRYDDLAYMPKTTTLLGSGGMTFSKAFVSKPLCCPSRASILTGMYVHNHNVWFNGTSGSDAGWPAFKAKGYEQDNLATRLSTAGYRTGLFGKYFPSYDGSSKPQGWDDWFGLYGAETYYNWSVNDNGTHRRYGNTASDYSTDVISSEAQSFIDTSVDPNVGQGKPFFAWVGVSAPHYPSTAAPRDLLTYDGPKAPRPLSFNEDDVSDKPPWISSLPKLSSSQIAQIDASQENRAETLQAVDDLVEGVVNKLDSAGVLNNTYIFFTSDNGFEMGEHRIFDGKREPYEESIHMPLLVRGPEVGAGSTTDKLALNIDFFPTFMELAGAQTQTPSYVDGRSLRPVLDGSATPTTWRTAILLETRFEGSTAKSFYGIRTSDGMKYIEYGGGFRELYNLNTDPHELSNAYKATSPPTSLAAQLQALKGCKGDSCRAAEDGR